VVDSFTIGLLELFTGLSDEMILGPDDKAPLAADTSVAGEIAVAELWFVSGADGLKFLSEVGKILDVAVGICCGGAPAVFACGLIVTTSALLLSVTTFCEVLLLPVAVGFTVAAANEALFVPFAFELPSVDTVGS
jgi:hypothetical protein